MTTPESTIHIQPLRIAAYLAFVLAVAIIVVATLSSLPKHLFKALLLLSASFVAFGVGEFINHPKQKLITRESVKGEQEVTYHHKRSSCALGNLFDICALLLFFIAISSILFPR